MIYILRVEKDVRLRIDLLEGQSSLIAKVLTRAISEHNEDVFAEYAKRLAVNRGKIEELMWVLGEKILLAKVSLTYRLPATRTTFSYL